MLTHVNMNVFGRTYLIILLIPVVLGLFPTPAHALSIEELGRPTGYVNDYSNILTSTEYDRLDAICRELEAANSAEMAIVIIDSLDNWTIEDFAQELFETWGIGKAESDNGILILIAYYDREWRVHIGYGIEGVIPDTLARRIMENELVPEFRAGDYGQGLINAATQFKNVISGEEYDSGASFSFLAFLITVFIFISAFFLIWLSVRVKCPRCGSRVQLTDDNEILTATYSNSGIRKKEYECTVCHHEFARMIIIPMLVHHASRSGSGGSKGWSSSGWSSGGSSFGGFGGGSSGGGGASGGW